MVEHDLEGTVQKLELGSTSAKRKGGGFPHFKQVNVSSTMWTRRIGFTLLQSDGLAILEEINNSQMKRNNKR